MPSNATAIIELVGKDNGLSAIVVKNTNAISELTDAAIAGTSGMSQYATATNDLGDAFKGIGGTAIDATKSIATLGSTTTQAYNDIAKGSERTIKAADVLGNKFAEMALSAAGLGKQTDAVNSALQPTAGFFSTVADEATGLGKAFQAINQLEKPLVGGLDRVSTTAGGLGDALSNLGSVGQFASQGLYSVANAAASLAGIAGTVDTVGDLYQVMEQIQEVAPDVASGIGEFASAGAGIGQSTLAMTDMNTELYLAAQAGKKFGNDMVKSLSGVYVKFMDNAFIVGQYKTVISTLSETVQSLVLHFNDFGRGLETVRNLGFDTQAMDMANSIGLIGENLVFNTEASKNFANAAVAAFSKVEDSMAFIATLPSGQAAGIPKLSKQLDDLVNGPLQNMISKGEAAAAMYQSLSAGIGAATGKLKESQPFMEAALKLSTGTDTAASTTVETLAKVTYAYNLNVKDATTTAAKLNGIVEEGIVTFPQLAGSIGRVAGVAAQAKVPMNELMGSIAALTKTMSADDAMTGYMSLLNAIAGAGEQSKKAASELGVQFDLQAIKAKGLLNVLKDLYDKSGGNVEKIKEIIPDSLAFGTSLTLMTTAFKEAKEKTEIIANKGSEDLEKLFGGRNQSMVRQMTSLVNGYEEALSSFGEKFADKFKPGVEFLRERLKQIQSLPESVKNTIGAIVSFNMAIEKSSGFISILIGSIAKIGVTLAIMRISSLAMKGELGLLRDVAMGLFQAFAAGAGRTAALTTAVNTLTGAEQIATASSKGLATAKGLLATINRILTADIGKETAAWMEQLPYHALSLKTTVNLTGVKTVLAVVTKGLSAAMTFLGTTLKALWISFGPLAIAVGAAVVIFQALSEVINFNILGFKSAAAEAQEYAAKLTDLGEATKSYTDILNEQNKAVDKSVEGYRKRIRELDEMRKKEKDPERKKAIEDDIKNNRTLLKSQQEKENKKYTGFYNTVVIPAMEAGWKMHPGFWGRGEQVEDFFKDVKDKRQSSLDDASGIFAAQGENQRQVNELFSRANRSAQISKKGGAVSAEAREILESTKYRTLSGQEMTKVLEAETKAYEENKKAIDDKVTALQAALEATKDPEKQEQIKRDIKQLNDATAEEKKYNDAKLQFIKDSNVIKEAQEGNKDPIERVGELSDQQRDKAFELSERMKSARTQDEKDFLEFQKQSAEASYQLTTEFGQGMLKNGELGKKQLNSLTAAYKEFADNPLKTEVGNAEDLNKMRSDADKFLAEIQNNIPNVTTATAESLVKALLNQKVKVKGSEIAQSILSPEQTQEAVDALQKIYEKSAQDQIDINDRKIAKINHQEALGLQKQGIAQKEILETEIKSNDEKIKSKQKYLDLLVSMGLIDKESDLYKKLNDELVNLQRQTELKKIKIVETAENEKAQIQVDINNRRIAKINHLEAMGIKRDSLAQKEVLENEVKSNEARIKAKQNYLNYLLSSGTKKESALYHQLNDELVNLQYETEQKKTKIIEAAINDRIALNKRGLDKEQAIAEFGFAARLNEEQKTQDKLFELRQKQNLNERKGISDRIEQLKARGGDYNELEIQLLKLMTEYENNINSRNKELDDRDKARLDNRVTQQKQILEKESNSLDLQSKQLERQKNVTDSKNSAAKAESEITQSRLELQLKVTGDIQKQADIEYAIAKEKIKNLQLSQKIERENLVTQRQLQQIAIDREIIANKIAKAENQRAIAALKIDLARAKREKRSVDELKAMELQLSSMQEQVRVLDETGKELEQNKKTQEEVNKNAERELLARQKISMAGGVLDEHQAKINQILAKYDKQIEQANLYTKQVELQNTRLTAQSEAMGKMYDLQNQVMDSQKSVLESRINRMTGELQIAMNLTTSETKRRDLAQTIAQIKLKTLEKQQEIERRVLEIQILQNKAALEREKIQLRVQQSQNKADVAGAFVNLQKVLAQPNSTNAQKQAALLEYQAKQEQGALLAFQNRLIGQKEQIQDFLENNQRSILRDSQSLARTQAEAEVIGTLSPRRQRREGRRLRDRILRERLDITPYNAINRQGGIDMGMPNAPQITSDISYEEFRKNYLSRQQEFLVPPSIKMPSLNTNIQKGKGENNKPEANTNIAEVKLIVEAINIDVSSNATPKDAAKDVKQAILDELHDLTAKVKTKLK